MADLFSNQRFCSNDLIISSEHKNAEVFKINVVSQILFLDHCDPDIREAL